MSLSNNKILGVKSKVKNIRRRVIDENITTAIYKRSEIRNRCNELSLTFRDGFQLEFRLMMKELHIASSLRRISLLM